MIIAIFLGGFFEITCAMITAMRTVQIRIVSAARIMGVKGWKLFLEVHLPASLLSLLPTLRVSVGYCWRALVGAEMLCAMIEWGLGKMIYEARFWNDVSVMFAGLIVIGVLGVIIDRLLLQRLETKTVVKWGMVKNR